MEIGVVGNFDTISEMKKLMRDILPQPVIAVLSYAKNYLFWKILLLVVFHFRPEWLYRLYPIRDRSLSDYVVNKHERLEKGSCFLDDFLFYSNRDQLFDEINIVMRGHSFEEGIDMDRSLPTFLVNWHKPDAQYKCSMGITADPVIYNNMLAAGISPILWLEVGPSVSLNPDRYKEFLSTVGINESLSQKNIKARQSNTNSSLATSRLESIRKQLVLSRKNMSPQLSLGSGLVAVIGLSRIAGIINIYGWDQYIDSPLDRKSYLGVLWTLGGTPTGNAWWNWSSVFKIFCSQLLAWNYAVEMTRDDRFRLFSHLSEAHKHTSITKRVHKFIYKDHISS